MLLTHFCMLYSLSISLDLQLLRADLKLSGSEFVLMIQMTVSFVNPRKIKSGWHDDRWRY